MIKILQSKFLRVLISRDLFFENLYENLLDSTLASPFQPLYQPPRFPTTQPSVKTWKGFVNRVYQEFFLLLSRSPGEPEALSQAAK